jgi:cobalt/nickel transport system permease protein
MSPIDRAAHLNRWRRKSLIEKAALALGMLALALAMPPFPGAVAVALVMALAALVGARVPVAVWAACAAAPAGFLLAGAASLLVQVDGAALSLAPGGTALAAGLAARSAAGITCLLFLALTTPVTDLMAGLRRLGLPPEVTEIALLMYRFIFLLADTALAMDTAQAARLGHVGFARRLRSLGVLIANLLPRAFDRARRLEVGLAARGWQGEMRVLSPSMPVSPAGLAAVLAAEGAVAALGAVWPLGALSP